MSVFERMVKISFKRYFTVGTAVKSYAALFPNDLCQTQDLTKATSVIPLSLKKQQQKTKKQSSGLFLHLSAQFISYFELHLLIITKAVALEKQFPAAYLLCNGSA